MIHPDTTLRYIGDHVGHGVVATRPIPAGTIVWVLDPLDQVLPCERWQALPEPVRAGAERHAFRLPSGDYVHCWDITRYVNHSFHPNTAPSPFGFDLALRDIGAGEELLGDYGMLCIEDPFHPHPEPGADRQVVRPDDALSLCERYDAVLAPLWAALPRLPQPLAALLPAEVWPRLEAIAAGREPPPRLREFYDQQAPVFRDVAAATSS